MSRWTGPWHPPMASRKDCPTAAGRSSQEETFSPHLVKADKACSWVRPGRALEERPRERTVTTTRGTLSAQAVPRPERAFMASAGEEQSTTAGTRW